MSHSVCITNFRWCLNLKYLSSAAYHSLRTAGFVKLPSERTLRDYTHYFKSKTGYQEEVDRMLKDEVGEEVWKKFVVVLVDEMKVKEGLVYDKHSCEVIGFAELDNIDAQLNQLEQSPTVSNSPPIATHLLALMVRGLFTSCRFPYAHFPTTAVTGDQLFSVVWEAIERLERIGLKVMAVTADGASSNRKFFRMHSSSGSTTCYKAVNPYAQERSVYFFSDVPHLIKTTRNCWSHSGANGTRSMWVSTS